ncbi:MAG: hypothetical protein JRI61_04405 [Deltaproteobacteria bacterium]|nr:hypothetical protein [Deltaproteobacteria bacterium]
MNQKMAFSHRRKWKRFTVKGGAVVILEKPRIMGLLGQSNIEFGPIVNISMGGLASQYIENKRRMSSTDKLSIRMPDKSIIVDKVSYKTIADFEVAEMPDGKKIRNRCVKFFNMSSYQTFRLDDFIKSFSISFMMDRRSGEERRKYVDPRYEDPEWNVLKERRSGLERRVYKVIL